MGGTTNRPAVLAHLQDAGARGLLIAELSDMLGLSDVRVNHAVKGLLSNSRVKWTLDPGYKAGFRCRWYATEHAPRSASSNNPGDARTQQRESLKTHRTVANKTSARLDPKAPALPSRVRPQVAVTPPSRFAVTTAPSVISSSECWDWARVALAGPDGLDRIARDAR